MDGMNMSDSCMFMDMEGMKMYFHFGSCEQLLFSSWRIKTTGGMVGAVVVSFVLAVLYEGLKSLRQWLLFYDYKHHHCSSSASASRSEGDTTRLINVGKDNESSWTNKALTCGLHLLQSMLHVVQVGWGYILMLIAMTYNGWLFLAVCFGAGVGYFVFAFFKTHHISNSINSRESNECCH